MGAWTMSSGTYTTADMAAFKDRRFIDSHFGLPLPYPSRVFSISLNHDGKSNVHEAPYRPHYFGNTWAYRNIKAQHPDAWIWDERYRFGCKTGFLKDPCMIRAQEEFIRLMGKDRITQIRKRALDENLLPDSLTDGKPDLAVHFPSRGDVSWKFIEIKLRGTKDKLKPTQIAWLQLLSDYFGYKAVVQLELREELSNKEA
jgi:hypothetical protein